MVLAALSRHWVLSPGPWLLRSHLPLDAAPAPPPFSFHHGKFSREGRKGERFSKCSQLKYVGELGMDTDSELLERHPFPLPSPPGWHSSNLPHRPISQLQEVTTQWQIQTLQRKGMILTHRMNFHIHWKPGTGVKCEEDNKSLLGSGSDCPAPKQGSGWAAWSCLAMAVCAWRWGVGIELGVEVLGCKSFGENR